jgi:lysophospholipase L1-like esterase
MPIRQHARITVASLALCIVIVALSGYAAPPAKPATLKPENKSVTPSPRISEWWFALQAEKIGLMSKGDIDLLMVGDSITHNFANEKVGLRVWKKYFVPHKAINLGAGGDRTENVLWRLDHLPVLKTAPKAAVLMIGTNNICWGSDTPKQAAEGTQAIVKKLKATYPDMKVLVLGVFPRRREPDHRHRKEIIELNSTMPGLLKGMKGVKFLDIGRVFLDDKGVLTEQMMPDGTHPSERAHEIWAETIMPELEKMLGTPKMVYSYADTPKPNASVKADQLTQGLKYKYFEGVWWSLPDYDKMKPLKEGVCKDLDISVATLRDRFGLSFSGYLYVPKAGTYSFAVKSDDGTVVSIGGTNVIYNDGKHADKARLSRHFKLEPGYYDLKVDYFQADGAKSIELLWTTKGPLKRIPTKNLFYKK